MKAFLSVSLIAFNALFFAAYNTIFGDAGMKRFVIEKSGTTTNPVAVATVTPQVVTKPKVPGFFEQKLTAYETSYGRPANLKEYIESDMVYKSSFTELPLDSTDYYKNKFENAKAGVKQLNNMPVVMPGNSIGVIKDGYLTIQAQFGYVKASGHFFGSGVCWSTSALGALLDNANANFKKKYGVDLIIYNKGDRAPHSDKYKTYTNGGYGYTVLEVSNGVPAQDYRFTINPKLTDLPELADTKIKIVMLATDQHKTAAHGQSIGGYIVSNKEF